MGYLENFQLTKRFYFVNLVATSTSPNQHQNHYHAHQGVEFLYIHQGYGRILLEQTAYDIQPGDLFIFQPYQLHSINVLVSDIRPYTRTMINVEPTFLEKYLQAFPELLGFFRYLWKGKLPMQILHQMNDSVIETFLGYYERKLASVKPKQQHETTALLMIDLLQIIQSAWNADYGDVVGKPLRHAEKITVWIEQNFREPFVMDRLVQELHLSKSVLSHVFKAETGSSISDYLLTRRVREACLMLGTTSLSIREIGVEIGMPHPSFFAKKFKQVTGLTPTECRDQYSRLGEDGLELVTGKER